MSFARMLRVLESGRVAAYASFVRPPYGSGYDGLLMLIAVCRSVVSSAPGVPFMIVLNRRPYPARTTDFPSPVTSHATPRRGETLFLSPRLWKFTYGRTRGYNDPSFFRFSF